MHECNAQTLILLPCCPKCWGVTIPLPPIFLAHEPVTRCGADPYWVLTSGWFTQSAPWIEAARRLINLSAWSRTIFGLQLGAQRRRLAARFACEPAPHVALSQSRLYRRWHARAQHSASFRTGRFFLSSGFLCIGHTSIELSFFTYETHRRSAGFFMYHRIQTITFDPRFINRDERIDVSEINGLLRIWSGTPVVCHSFDIVAHENITFRRINLGLSCH
jgi:hypothetical protein